jgi:hypothetical protein
VKKVLAALALVGAIAGTSPAANYYSGTLVERESRPTGAPGHFKAAANVAEYSNITSYQALVITQASAANVAGDQITRLLADDITPLGAHAGADVTSFTFSVANFNANPVTIRPLARFWNADGAGGRPGTAYVTGGFNFDPVTIPAYTVTLLQAFPSAYQFPMPGAKFWAAVTFDDDNGATGVTLTELDEVGQGGFYPPTVGSSADLIFQTNSAGSFLYVNNPFGFLYVYAPIGFNASTAWEFVVDETVPVRTMSWGRLKAVYR